MSPASCGTPAYRARGKQHLPPEYVTAMLADQLILGGAPRSPIETLREDAAARAEWMKRATWLVPFAVIALGGLTAALLVEGGV
jgi:hypothetical protein